MNEESIKLCAYTLFSSSKGNATYVCYGDDEILIDAGMSAKAINTSLESIGTSLERIGAIFITHEHSDHVRGLPVIAKKYNIPIHVTAPSAKKLLARMGGTGEIHIHEPVFEHRIGKILVQSFITPHDSEMSVGYRLSLGDATLAVATDIGYVSEDIRRALSGADYVLLESNHDREMLIYGDYPYTLKQRILSRHGHLSNDDCAEFVSALAEGGTRRVLLGHLSENNNTPERAYSCCRDRLTSQNIKWGPAHGFDFGVAEPYKPTRLA